MKIDDYKDSLMSLIEAARSVYLSTLDAEGYPSTRAMLNLRNKKLYPHLHNLYQKEKNPFTIYLTTNTSSLKMKELSANNKVCLYFCDDSNYRGITLQGHTEVITDKDFKQFTWIKAWEEYYPEGANSEDFTLLRFTPDKLKSYGEMNELSAEII